MAWQGYIDSLRTADHTGMVPVADAAIWGMEKGSESQWACSPGLTNITVDEIKKLAGDRKGFAQNGAYIGGTRCRLIRDQLDTEGMYTMDLKSAADADGNTYGVCVGKTNKAFVIVKGVKDANGGQLANKVFSTVDYLRKSGY